MNLGSSIVSVQTSQTKKSVLCDIYLTNDIFLSIICNIWKRTTRCKQRSPLHTAQHWSSVDKVTNPSYPGGQKQSLERARVKGLIWARGKNGNWYLGVLVTIFCCALCFLCWIWECHDNGRLPTIPQPRSFQCTRSITHSNKVLSRQWWNKKYRANFTIIEPPYNSHILPSQQGETDVCIYKPPSNGGKNEDSLPCDFQPLLQAPPLWMSLLELMSQLKQLALTSAQHANTLSNQKTQQIYINIFL